MLRYYNILYLFIFTKRKSKARVEKIKKRTKLNGEVDTYCVVDEW
jgi:hypothetical protein